MQPRHVSELPKEFVDRMVSSICEAVDVKRIYVFGSYARGEATQKSDIDIFVVTKGDGDGSRVEDIALVRKNLRWIKFKPDDKRLPKGKDVICDTESQWDDLSRKWHTLEHAVLTEGTLLYEDDSAPSS